MLRLGAAYRDTPEYAEAVRQHGRPPQSSEGPSREQVSAALRNAIPFDRQAPTPAEAARFATGGRASR